MVGVLSSSTEDRIAEFDTSTPDPGWFGPDSVSWRVHHDPAALVGGLRALMLQSLLPGVMHGFYVNTDVHDDPGPAMRTAGYVNVVVYGTRAEADALAARIRRVHRNLRVDDAEWLLWVHCGAVDSWLQSYRASGGPLTDAEADAYVAEQVRAATLVGVRPGRCARDGPRPCGVPHPDATVLEATAEARGPCARCVAARWPHACSSRRPPGRCGPGGADRVRAAAALGTPDVRPAGPAHDRPRRAHLGPGAAYGTARDPRLPPHQPARRRRTPAARPVHRLTLPDPFRRPSLVELVETRIRRGGRDKLDHRQTQGPGARQMRGRQ